jgi:hypothetical protein
MAVVTNKNSRLQDRGADGRFGIMPEEFTSEVLPGKPARSAGILSDIPWFLMFSVVFFFVGFLLALFITGVTGLWVI